MRRLRPETQTTLTGDVTHEPYPSDSDPIAEFSLCAVVKTWMDEDVIEATVRSAMAQGVDSVYIVDNGSTDDTLAIAEAAGATIGEVYRTTAFDGRLAQTLMNAVAARESLRNGAPHVWWLYLDTDEFPEGPGGSTIREYLTSLDRRFRLVGASYVNHYPSGKPEYISGFHPIDLQPLCYEFAPARWPPCAWGHWKHPLQRFDADGQFILSNDGSHTAFSNDLLIAPTGGIVPTTSNTATRPIPEPNSISPAVQDRRERHGTRRRGSTDLHGVERLDALLLPGRAGLTSTSSPTSIPTPLVIQNHGPV